MLTLRQRLFAMLGGVLLIIALILLGIHYGPRLFSKPAAPDVATSTPTTVPVLGTVKKLAPPINYGLVTTSTPDELYLRQLAEIFVERFASYSNQDNQKNIIDVLPLATVQMQTWIKTQGLAAGRIYAGATTRVMSTRIESKDENKAVIKIAAQQERSGALVTTTTAALVQRKGTVRLLNVNGVWLVDGLFWE